MPMVAIFTLIDSKLWRTVIVLRDQRRRFGFLSRSVANFLLVPHPAFLRNMFMILRFCHNKPTLRKGYISIVAQNARIVNTTYANNPHFCQSGPLERTHILAKKQAPDRSQGLDAWFIES